MTNVLRLALPFTLWIIGFSALYGLQGLACSRHWPPNLDARTALIAAAALFILVQGLVLAMILSRPIGEVAIQCTTCSAIVRTCPWNRMRT